MWINGIQIQMHYQWQVICDSHWQINGAEFGGITTAINFLFGHHTTTKQFSKSVITASINLCQSNTFCKNMITKQANTIKTEN